MTTPLTPQQDLLEQVMSDISEDCWCAGWLIGTEYRLWMALTDPTDHKHWGQGVIGELDIEKLRWLSKEIGGWMTGDGFVPMVEWEKMYAAHEGPIRRDAP